jgi:DNA-binding response OmpR family regulator
MSFSYSGSLPPVVLVLETAPRWAPELQRQFLTEPVSVRQRTRADDVRALCAAGTVGLLLVNLDAREEIMLHVLKEVGQARSVPCFAVAPAENRILEWAVRELGIEGFALEPVSGELLADRIRRRLLPDRSSETSNPR